MKKYTITPDQAKEIHRLKELRDQAGMDLYLFISEHITNETIDPDNAKLSIEEYDALVEDVAFSGWYQHDDTLESEEESEGFFRHLDIPYEGLTDDEKECW